MIQSIWMLVSRQQTDISKTNSNGCICSLAYGTQTKQTALESSARGYVKAMLSLCVCSRVTEFRVLSVCLGEWWSTYRHDLSPWICSVESVSYVHYLLCPSLYTVPNSCSPSSKGTGPENFWLQNQIRLLCFPSQKRINTQWPKPKNLTLWNE